MLTDSEKALTPQDRERLRMAFYHAMAKAEAIRVPEEASAPTDTGEGPTPQRLAMAEGEIEDYLPEEGRITVRMLDGSAVAMLFNRGVIDADEYNAGEQFYGDFYDAGFASSGVIDPARDVVDGGPVTRENDRRIDAATRFKTALQAVGRVHSRALIDVVLFDVKLEAFGLKRYRKRDPKDARLAAQVALKGALGELANHYYGKRRTRTQASHADGYRPVSPPPDS